MDQNIRSKGALLSSVILSGSAIGAIVLGLSMTSNYQNEMWWVGLLLLLCGVLVSCCAISIYRSSRQEKKISDEQIAAINDVKRGKASESIKVQILANWVYTVSEWKE